MSLQDVALLLSGSSHRWIGGKAAPMLPAPTAPGKARRDLGAELAQGCFRLCPADCDLHKTFSPSPGSRSRRRLLFPRLAEPEKLGARGYSLQRGIQPSPALTHHLYPRAPLSISISPSLLARLAHPFPLALRTRAVPISFSIQGSCSAPALAPSPAWP